MSSPWLAGAANGDQTPGAPDPIVGPGEYQDTSLPLYRDVIPRVINVASPVAGAAWAAGPEGGRIWHVQAATAQLVTSAAAGTRKLTLRVTDGTSTLYQIPSSIAVTATLIVVMSWLRGYGAVAGGTTLGAISVPLPQIPVLGGQTIDTTLANLDVADQWSGITLYVYEVAWLPLPPGDSYPRDALTYRRQYGGHLLGEVD